MKKITYFLSFVLFMVCINTQILAQCSPDNTAPSLVVPDCGGSFIFTISNGTNYLDELSWELRDAANNVVASHGAYPTGSGGGTQTDVVANGPFSFYIETQGTNGDNEADYEITCGGNVLLSGFISADTSFTFTNLCNGIVVNSTTGMCGAVVNYTATATDACDPNPTITANHNSGATFPVGTTLVTVTANDASMNSEVKSFTIVVKDIEAPSITCPATQILGLDTTGQAILPDYTSLATSSDNCSGTITITQDPAVGTTIIGSGITPVMLTATDEAGNSTPCTFNVDHSINTPSITITTPSINNDSLTTCLSTSITLSGPPAAEYLWYKDGIAINYSLSPTYTIGSIVGTSVYTLSVVYPSTSVFSAQSAPITIIRTQPSATITPSGSTTFCANNPITLQANTGGSTYTWKRSNVTVQTGTSNTYIPTITGNHSVTVTDANGCSKMSSWTNITIKPLPNTNAGADKSICKGTSVQIGGSSTIGNTYTWSPTIGLSAPYSANPMASPNSNTTYILTAYSNNCSKSDTVVITSLSVPSIPALTTTNTPVCQGTSINITPVANGATSVDWYRNGIKIHNKPTTFTQIISQPTAIPDMYSIKSKSASGCLSGFSNIISAHVKEAPIPTITSNPTEVGTVITVCVLGGTSGNATLTANSTMASPAYSWKLAGNYIPNANNNTYIQNVGLTQNNQVVSVEASYPNGCSKTSTTKTVKFLNANCFAKITNEYFAVNEDFSIQMYPNPAQDLVSLNIENSKDKIGMIMIYNTLGQLVLSKEVALQEDKITIEINIKALPLGLYTLSFATTNEQYSQKLIKE